MVRLQERPQVFQARRPTRNSRSAPPCQHNCDRQLHGRPIPPAISPWPFANHANSWRRLPATSSAEVAVSPNILLPSILGILRSAVKTCRIVAQILTSRSPAGAAVKAENRRAEKTAMWFYGFPPLRRPRHLFLLNRTAEHKKIPARFPGRGVLGGPAYSPLVLRARDQISV